MLVPFFASLHQPTYAYRPLYTRLWEDLKSHRENIIYSFPLGRILSFAHVLITVSLCFVTVRSQCVADKVNKNRFLPRTPISPHTYQCVQNVTQTVLSVTRLRYFCDILPSRGWRDRSAHPSFAEYELAECSMGLKTIYSKGTVILAGPKACNGWLRGPQTEEKRGTSMRRLENGSAKDSELVFASDYAF
jgi:hypothetical protein